MEDRGGCEVSRLADHLFRQESGKLVSVLTGLFGIDRLQLAEDVVQEALVRALRSWPFYGVPQNPAAWLTQTAKNLALDTIRRERLFRDKEPQITAFFEHWHADAAGEPAFDTEIRDGRLRLIFACGHPLLPPEAQTALALRTLCGFGVEEIARAFLTTEAAVAKRLTRARQRIRECRIPFEIPSGAELADRLTTVLQTIYLLFSEGYKASAGDRLIREECCHEAIRLGLLLAEHPLTSQPRTHALLALMLLNAARFPARVDAAGRILRLEEQNRARWSRELIGRGLFHLAEAATGDELTEYHLQAGIAACHATAADYAETDWPQILRLYDRLLEQDASPVVALNRAVALGFVEGPAAGAAAVRAIKDAPTLETYHLSHAVLADFEVRLGRPAAAADHLREALRHTVVSSERELLTRRLRDCEALLV